ncbi:MAG: DUF4396 domain-containing protein [Reichenbachiella sp.]
METLTLDTTLHCENCVSKVTPHLNESSFINDWKVDLSTEPKTITVSGEGVTSNNIAELLQKEGYDVIESKSTQPNNSFWSDRIKWKRASFNTLNCLIGCSIGDFGMLIFLQANYPDTSMTVQMVLAIIAGLCTSIALETVILKSREGFGWMLALKTAFGMSFISMVGMEIAMNLTDFMMTGGKAAFEDPMYWTALGVAMIAGFIAPLPYNYYKLKKFNQACH